MPETIRDWTTEAGLSAMIRQVCMPFVGTWLCGYVGVPQGHPLHGRNFGEHVPELAGAYEKAMDGPVGVRGIIPAICARDGVASMDLVFNVHGSVTYAGRGWSDDGLWWIGFDCQHAGDEDGHCDESYVANECELLAKQIAEAVGA